jgi:hypothetical protein
VIEIGALLAAVNLPCEFTVKTETFEADPYVPGTTVVLFRVVVTGDAPDPVTSPIRVMDPLAGDCQVVIPAPLVVRT